MIFKKIKANPKKAKSKAAHIRDLTSYINDPQRLKENEKVLYANGRGFICDDLLSRQHEMIALASEAPKSKNPITHYLLSWREGEQPTPEQVEEAVSLLLAEMGLVDHQVMYALHQDTDNYHLHIAVNRVHPDTYKVIKPNKGFDIEAGHRSIAKIEMAQGWQSEKNARYTVIENGEIEKDQKPAKGRQPEQRKRDRENRTGEKSAERIAIENAASIIQESTTWPQLHERLAHAGMRYERKGSGALIFVNDIPLKPSSVDRGASMPALEKRLGAFVPARAGLVVQKREAEPIKRAPGWAQYKAARDEHYGAKRGAQTEMRARHTAERNALFSQHKTRRDGTFKKDWKGKGDLLNAMRSVLAAEQAAEKVALQERQAQERKTHQVQFRPFPDLEAWLRYRALRPDLAEAWRYRDNLSSQPARVEGRDQQKRPAPRDIRSFTSTIKGREVRYSHRDGGALAFTDTGKHIAVADERNPTAVLAALQLGSQKFPGGMTLTGNAEYKALCVRLAAEHGLKIINPELQADINAARETLKQERSHVTRTQPYQNHQSRKYSKSAISAIPPAHRRDRLHNLSELALVANKEATAQVLLQKDVPGSVGVGDGPERNGGGLRRTGGGGGGRGSFSHADATSAAVNNTANIVSGVIVKEGAAQPGGFAASSSSLNRQAKRLFALWEEKKVAARAAAKADRLAAAAAQDLAAQPDTQVQGTEIAQHAQTADQWISANSKPSVEPKAATGRVVFVDDAGEWVQDRGRSVIKRQPNEFIPKIGDMVSVDGEGKAKLVGPVVKKGPER